MTLEAISQRRDRSLTVMVRNELESMILRGELQSGERLNEHALAKQMGVSRGPIREAARLLERDGLVTSVANRGVFVRQLSIDDALELYDLRAIIAGYACSCVAARATTEEKAELRSIVDEMDDCIGREDTGEYLDLNIRFHDRIAELSGAQRTFDLYASFSKEVRLLRRRVLQDVASMKFSNEEHKQILAAIESGNTVEARESAERHHINGKSRWLDTLNQRQPALKGMSAGS